MEVVVFVYQLLEGGATDEERRGGAFRYTLPKSDVWYQAQLGRLEGLDLPRYGHANRFCHPNSSGKRDDFD